jgi:heme A synthase
VEPTPAEHRPALHVAAVVTLCLTFPLIFLGGLVTSHGAGMSVPDWPNSYGYNMFLFPPSKWVGGILYEHTHRLLGTVVGFCATVMTLVAWGPARTGRGRRWIAWTAGGLLVANGLGTAAMVLFPAAFRLPATARHAAAIVPQGAVTAVGIVLTTAVAWRCRHREPRRWVRWLATACLLAVCAQGLLGGLRVDLINLPLAMVHGCFAQLTFCLMVVTAAVTGPVWKSLSAEPDVAVESSTVPLAPGYAGVHGGDRRDCASRDATSRSLRETPAEPGANGADAKWRETGGGLARVRALAYVTVAVVFAQLIVAAVMRHLGAGLAIPDVPLAYGHLLPPLNAEQLRAANHFRVWKLGLPPVTVVQVWLHFGHRLGALAVSAAVVTLVATIFRSARGLAALTKPAAALLVLLLTQLTLGVWTVYRGKPADVASAHVACGALLLATTALIAVRASGLYVLRSPRSARVVAGPVAGDLVAV